MTVDKHGIEVTDDTWGRVDAAITLFIQMYPLDWSAFQRDLRRNRTQYQLAVEGDLKKSSFRNTLAFPVIGRPRTEEEIAADPGHSSIQFGDSLKEWLEDIIPGFTAPDEGVGKGLSGHGKDVKKNKLYWEFIKRYQKLFVPGESV